MKPKYSTIRKRKPARSVFSTTHRKKKMSFSYQPHRATMQVSSVLTWQLLLISLLVFFINNPSFAGVKNWEGDVSSDWNDANNWQGNSFPGGGDDVEIDPSNYTYAPIISSNSSFSCKKVKVLNGAVLTIQANLSINDNFEVDGGGSTIPTVNMSAGTLSVNANKDFKVKRGGVFNLTGGTLSVSDDMEIDDGGTLNINQSSGTSTVTVTGYLMIKANLASSKIDMDAGTFTVGDYVLLDGNNKPGFHCTLDISGGTFTNNGATQFDRTTTDSTLITISGGTVTLVGAVTDAAPTVTGKLSIKISGGSLTFQNNLTMASVSRFTQTGGTITFQGGNRTWSNAGTFSATAGTVVFNDATNTQLTSTGSWTFYDVTINS